MDAVAGMFSNENIQQFDNEFDPHNILVGVDKILGIYKDKNGTSF